MPFLKTLAQSETYSASFRIWTRVTISIFYDENRYVKKLNSQTNRQVANGPLAWTITSFAIVHSCFSILLAWILQATTEKCNREIILLIPQKTDVLKKMELPKINITTTPAFYTHIYIYIYIYIYQLIDEVDVVSALS